MDKPAQKTLGQRFTSTTLWGLESLLDNLSFIYFCSSASEIIPSWWGKYEKTKAWVRCLVLFGLWQWLPAFHRMVSNYFLGGVTPRWHEYRARPGLLNPASSWHNEEPRKRAHTHLCVASCRSFSAGISHVHFLGATANQVFERVEVNNHWMTPLSSKLTSFPGKKCSICKLVTFPQTNLDRAKWGLGRLVPT